MLESEAPVRHGWAWLKPNWADFLRAPIDAQARCLIEDWRTRNLPFVVAAVNSIDGARILRLGLATREKRRIGFDLGGAALDRAVPPPSLREALCTTPVQWRVRLHSLDAQARKAGIEVSVYGSLAWSVRSSLPFVRTDSDVDLLFVPCGATLSRIYSFLHSIEQDEGVPRLDGEMLFDGGAVSWRELVRRPEMLLVKSSTGPCLQSRSRVEELIRVCT